VKLSERNRRNGETVGRGEKKGHDGISIMAERKRGDVTRHGRSASNISFLFKSSDLNSAIWRGDNSLS
jgi:hypothetical protein